MGKDSFVLYKSFYQPIKGLSDKQLGRLFRAIYDYQTTGEIAVEPDIEMAFAFFRNQFDLDDAKYQKVVGRNSENGLKGGRPRKTEEKNLKNPKNPLGLQKPKKADNDNDNDIIKNNTPNGVLQKREDNDDTTPTSDSDQEKKVPPKKRSEPFKPPEPLEVAEYITSHGYAVNADRFCNYYTSNGWQVGRNKMKDWRAAVRTWNLKNQENGCKNTTSSNGGRPTKQQRDAEFAEYVARNLQNPEGDSDSDAVWR